MCMWHMHVVHQYIAQLWALVNAFAGYSYIYILGVYVCELDARVITTEMAGICVSVNL